MSAPKKMLFCLCVLVFIPKLQAQDVHWGKQVLDLKDRFYSIQCYGDRPYLFSGSDAWQINSLDNIEPVSKSNLGLTDTPVMEGYRSGEEMNIYFYGKKKFTLGMQKLPRIGWRSISNVNSFGAFADRSDGFYNYRDDSKIHAVSNFGITKSKGVWNTNYMCSVKEQLMWFVSPDESKYVFVTLKPEDKSEIDKYDVVLADSTGKKMGQATLIMPLPMDKIKLHGFGVTDKGTPFCIYKQYDANRKDKALSDYRMIVSIIDMTTGELRPIEVSTEGKWIKSICIRLTDEHITLNGLFADKQATAGANFDGVFYADIDLASQKSSSGTTYFPEGTVFTWEPRINHSNNYFRIVRMVMEEDGIAYVLSSDYSVSEAHETTERYARGLVFIKTDYKGKVLVSHKINRNFSESGDQMRLSTYLTKYGTDYYMVYCVPTNQIDFSTAEKVPAAFIRGSGLALVCTKMGSKKTSTVLIPDLGSKSIEPLLYGCGTTPDGILYMAIGDYGDEKITLNSYHTKVRLGSCELH